MLDLEVLSAVIADRAAYDKVGPFVSPKEMTPTVGFWYEKVGEWYKRDPSARSVDLNLLVTGASESINAKHRETFVAVVRALVPPASPANTVQIALELKRRQTALAIAAAATDGDSKKLKALTSSLADLMAATTLGQKAEIIVAPPVEDLFSVVSDENRIPLAPDRLNSRIGGGALPGHNIFVFGRPDAGKTAFVVNLAVVLAVRGYRVLYIGNEDHVTITKSRALCRACSMTWAEAQANKEKAVQLYRKRGVEDRLQFMQVYDGSLRHIYPEIVNFKPHVVIVDQLRGMDGEGDSMTQQLEENGKTLRRMELEHGVIGVSVGQAGPTASGKPYVDMEMIADSKTGLQGTMDLILGIGFTQEMYARNERMIAPSKNKLSADSIAKEGLMVEFDNARSKFT